MQKISFLTKVENFLNKAKFVFTDNLNSFTGKWFSFFKKFYSDFSRTWLWDHVRFILVYGFLISFSLTVLFGQPFFIDRIIAWGVVYYFFRFELFYWLRGIKG